MNSGRVGRLIDKQEVMAASMGFGVSDLLGSDSDSSSVEGFDGHEVASRRAEALDIMSTESAHHNSALNLSMGGVASPFRVDVVARGSTGDPIPARDTSPARTVSTLIFQELPSDAAVLQGRLEAAQAAARNMVAAQRKAVHGRLVHVDSLFADAGLDLDMDDPHSSSNGQIIASLPAQTRLALHAAAVQVRELMVSLDSTGGSGTGSGHITSPLGSPVTASEPRAGVLQTLPIIDVKLQVEVQSLKEQLVQARAGAVESSRQFEEAKDALQSSASVVSELQAQLRLKGEQASTKMVLASKQHSQTVSTLNLALNTLETRVAELQAQLSAARSEAEELQIDRDTARKQADAAAEKVEEVKQTAAAREALLREKAARQFEVIRQTGLSEVRLAQAEGLRLAAAAREEERQVLKAVEADSEASVVAAAAETVVLQERIVVLEEELSGVKRAFFQAQDEIKISKANSVLAQEAAVELQQSLRDEIAGLQSEISSRDAHWQSRLHESVSAAESKCAETILGLQAQCEALKRSMADVAVERDTSIQAIQRQGVQVQDQVARLQSQLSDFQALPGRLLPKLASATAELAHLRAAHAGIRDEASSGLAALQRAMLSSLAQVSNLSAGHSAAMQDTVERLRREGAERRRLHNLVQEMRGNIRVYARVRPQVSQELKAGDIMVASVPEEDVLSLVTGKTTSKKWAFDRVYAPKDTNEDIFRDVEGLVTSALDGYNVSIFAYGQTGSGKTYTMEGREDDRGLNFRALETLFSRAGTMTASGWKVDIGVSMMEIYRESLRDMLAPAGSSPPPASGLAVREMPGGGVFVQDLTVRRARTLDDVLTVMRMGYKGRTTFATNMNEHSSRSHALLTVLIMANNSVTGATARGKLQLVDLAGSERLSRSGATGERLKEAQAINKSLSALGDVIAAMADKKGHVPYRNSTLTWVLSDSLGGDSKTLMFVNVSPTASNVDETACSLNFAARVKTVELGRATKHAGAAKAALPVAEVDGRVHEA